jgi:hypothetical protein
MTFYTNLEISGIEFNNIDKFTLNKTISENDGSSKLVFSTDNIAGKNKSVFAEGQPLDFYAGSEFPVPSGGKIFAGIITDVKFSGKGVDEKIDVTARDYTALLQQVDVEPEVYTNNVIGSIVIDLMNKYGPTEITTNNVNFTSKTLNRISFNHISLFDALKQLSEYVDYYMYVDDDKDLHFEEKASVSSGFTLNNTNTYKNRVETDIDNVYNRVYVYGARQLVAAPTESFTADGVGSVFTLNENPKNTEVQVSGVDKVGGVFGQNITPESGTDFLVNYDDKKIIFVSGTDLGYSAIPGSLDPVTVNYDASRPIIKRADDFSSQALYKVRTKTIINENINDPSEAKDIATNQLALNKDPKTELKLSVNGIYNILPGQTFVANFPNNNVNFETYEVIKSKFKFNKKTCNEENVLEVTASSRMKDINDVLKDLILSVQRLEAGQIDTTGILSRLLLGAGSFGLKVGGYRIQSRNIGNSRIYGHPVNGIYGSPAPAINGSQVTYGDSREAGSSVLRSGVFGVWPMDWETWGTE